MPSSSDRTRRLALPLQSLSHTQYDPDRSGAFFHKPPDNDGHPSQTGPRPRWTIRGCPPTPELAPSRTSSAGRRATRNLRFPGNTMPAAPGVGRGEHGPPRARRRGEEWHVTTGRAAGRGGRARATKLGICRRAPQSHSVRKKTRPGPLRAEAAPHPGVPFPWI
jgi:hypothetical protein